MSQMIVTSQDYQRGYDDGLQEGEQRGWEKGREAAATYHLTEAKGLRALVRPGNRLVSRGGRADTLQYAEEHASYAGAIRKLKKP